MVVLCPEKKKYGLRERKSIGLDWWRRMRKGSKQKRKLRETDRQHDRTTERQREGDGERESERERDKRRRENHSNTDRAIQQAGEYERANTICGINGTGGTTKLSSLLHLYNEQDEQIAYRAKRRTLLALRGS